METLRHKIEHQLQPIEEQLATWKDQCDQLESQLKAQSELEHEMHSQLYLEEDNSSHSELLDAVKREEEQIKTDLKEVSQSVQESERRKEEIVQHIEWIHSLVQQLVNGAYCTLREHRHSMLSSLFQTDYYVATCVTTHTKNVKWFHSYTSLLIL